MHSNLVGGAHDEHSSTFCLVLGGLPGRAAIMQPTMSKNKHIPLIKHTSHAVQNLGEFLLVKIVNINSAISLIKI